VHPITDATMLAPTVDTVRLTLHVLAATVWVGGQIVMTGLVGPARSVGGDTPKVLARAFARIAWPAYVVLLATGIWNISAVHASSQSSTWKAVLMAKVAVVVVAGIGVFLHQRATSKAQLALWGSVGGLASVAALVMGVLLAG
jgi:putative copper export protein